MLGKIRFGQRDLGFFISHGRILSLSSTYKKEDVPLSRPDTLVARCKKGNSVSVCVDLQEKATLSLHQEQILNQEGGLPVPDRHLESLQDGGVIPSFCQDENLSTKRVFLPHPLDCGLFCTSTSRAFFSSKKATVSTRRRKEGCRFSF